MKIWAKEQQGKGNKGRNKIRIFPKFMFSHYYLRPIMVEMVKEKSKLDENELKNEIENGTKNGKNDGKYNIISS